MQEVTRVHIAKTSYDIEIAAKKELEKYITKLETYADDPNLLEDIEIRITEILAARSIEKDGVITNDDVKAIRKQLGEPKDFIGEEDMALGIDSHDEGKPTHRLYRDTDSAVFAGVLSGIAKYFRISPIWTRLAFFVALIVSSGLAFLAYIILWIVVPQAKTAAEKLELAGKPITLASIKVFSSRSEDSTNNTPKTIQGIVLYAAGVFVAIGAIGVLAATLWAGGALLWDANYNSTLYEFAPSASVTGLVAFIGLVAAGLLLATLLSLLAYALLARTWTKRLTISIIAVVIAGVVSFSSGIGSFIYGQWQASTAARAAQTIDKVTLATNFKDVKSLTVNVEAIDYGGGDRIGIPIEYIVDDTPRYELSAVRGSYTPKIEVQGNEATLTVTGKKDRHNRYVPPTLTVYGPALEKITIKDGSMRYRNNEKQSVLSIVAEKEDKLDSVNGARFINSSFEAAGLYELVNVTTRTSTSVILDTAIVENLTIDAQGGYVSAEVVRSLEVQQASICSSSDESQNMVVVRDVMSGKFTYNGIERDANTIEGACSSVTIGDEDEHSIKRRIQ